MLRHKELKSFEIKKLDKSASMLYNYGTYTSKV